MVDYVVLKTLLSVSLTIVQKTVPVAVKDTSTKFIGQ